MWLTLLTIKTTFLWCHSLAKGHVVSVVNNPVKTMSVWCHNVAKGHVVSVVNNKDHVSVVSQLGERPCG